MVEETLFDLPEVEERKREGRTSRGQARVLRPVRDQMEWAPRKLDELLAEEHPARMIWALLERLDLSLFYVSIKAVLGHAGHPATDPQVLLALWLYATTEGVGSARQLARLCEEHDVYRWLCGGVSVNYHMLSDFRAMHQEALDNLLTEILASLLREGLVTLRHVAQDGMRVRANAGAGSFRRGTTLRQCWAEAQRQVAQLAVERESPDTTGRSVREEAAHQRATQERQRRVEKALRHLPEMEKLKQRRSETLGKGQRDKVSEARVSTTDAEAHTMKMADGGYRPAYNLQMATDVDSQVIVGVAVVTTGSDGGQALPVVEQVWQRTKRVPAAYLIDGGFATRHDITQLERRGITVYAPTRPPRSKSGERTQAESRRDDTPEVAAWRARMETPEAKTIYKERAATAECVNAQGRRHGLRRLLVRGAHKVASVLLLAAIAHNLLRWIALSA